jgi:hypothetical protein
MESESREINEDKNYIVEKSEIFVLVLTVMLRNRDIFRLLLRKCSFILNDIHIDLLTNYLLEAEWMEGLKALFTSPTTH